MSLSNRICRLCSCILLLLLAVNAFSGCTRKEEVEALTIANIEEAGVYHVIVVGSDPEGIAAAISCARNGLKTLLITEDEELGGLFTLGELNFLDMNYGPKNELLTKGFFEEFYNDMGNAFDIEKCKEWFMTKCKAEPNLDLLLNVDILGPVMSENVITGIQISEDPNLASHIGIESTIEQKVGYNPQVEEQTEGISSDIDTDAQIHGQVANGSEIIEEEEETDNIVKTKVYRAARIIDCTPDADIAAASGVPYTVGGEDYGYTNKLQAVTLVFEVTGLDWNKITDYLEHDESESTSANSNSAWGYGTEALNYKPIDENIKLRGPNIAKLSNGNCLLNCLLIFGVDAMDPNSVQEGIERGEKELPNIINFMKYNYPGFEKVEYVRHAEKLYIRETRHIQGEYRLTINDILENTYFEDQIALGSYPVDIQATDPKSYGNVIGSPAQYSIPLGCIIPKEIDNLLVASRSASYDSLAHGSTRVVPVGMSVAQAAGVVATYSIAKDIQFRDLLGNDEAVSWIQKSLKNQGAYLPNFKPVEYDFETHWAYEGLKVMRLLGLVGGGYSNEYGLDNPNSGKWSVQNKINNTMKYANAITHGEVVLVNITFDHDDITLGDLMISVATCHCGAEHVFSSDEEKEARDYLIQEGIITPEMEEHFKNLSVIATTGQVYSLIGSLYTNLIK